MAYSLVIASSLRFASVEYALMFASCVRYQPVQVFGDAGSNVARAQGVNRFSINSPKVGRACGR